MKTHLELVVALNHYRKRLKSIHALDETFSIYFPKVMKWPLFVINITSASGKSAFQPLIGHCVFFTSFLISFWLIEKACCSLVMCLHPGHPVREPKLAEVKMQY